MNRLGFQNVLLVAPDTLEVFYSYEQSAILGTNLASGPYASTNLAALARALSASKDVDDYRVSDFEEYRPRLGAPGAFMASPVFDGPRFVAILLLRFRIEPIEDALSGGRQWEAEGLGKTGEVYLLGPDQTMRSNSRFLIENPKAFVETLRRSRLTSRTADAVERLHTTILTVPVTHAAGLAALRGQSGLMATEDYRGVDALVAYGPVDLDSLRWAVIAKIDRQEAMAPLTAYTRRALAVGGALALLASVVALFMAAALTRPIAALVDAARRVSKGTLDVQVDVAPDDEYPRARRGLQRDGAKPSRQPRGPRPPGGGERAPAAKPAAGIGRRPGQGRHVRDAAVVRRRDRRAHQSDWPGRARARAGRGPCDGAC